jgi:hypothetical protein
MIVVRGRCHENGVIDNVGCSRPGPAALHAGIGDIIIMIFNSTDIEIIDDKFLISYGF